MTTPIPTHPHRSTRAFTLIELLVVVSIIAVLAGLAFPVLGRARASSDNVKCLSNMRQLGVGILGYANDHDGTLPGPLWNGQGTSYTTNDPNLLLTQIAPYTGLPAATSKWQYATQLACPARRRATTKGEVNYLVRSTINVDGQTYDPFGAGKTTGGDYGPGIKLAQISNLGISKHYMLIDVDQQWPGISTAGWAKDTPAKPAHGKHRNALCFDMHAVAFPVLANGSSPGE